MRSPEARMQPACKRVVNSRPHYNAGLESLCIQNRGLPFSRPTQMPFPWCAHHLGHGVASSDPDEISGPNFGRTMKLWSALDGCSEAREGWIKFS